MLQTSREIKEYKVAPPGQFKLIAFLQTGYLSEAGNINRIA